MRLLLALLLVITTNTTTPVWSQTTSQPSGRNQSRSQAKNSDGPYVLWEGGRADVHWIKEGKHVMDSFVAPFALALPAFKAPIMLDGKPYPKAIDEVTRPQKIFAISDVHGTFDVMRDLLIAHKVINKKNRWTFGKGHLVIAGDIADRGDHMTEAYWFIRALEESAIRAGGGVHMIIGNHEAMIMTGDYRYMNPYYANKVDGMPELGQLWGKQSEICRWLQSRPMMIKLGNILFVHGGISTEFMSRGLDKAIANKELRFLPREERNELDRFLLGNAGPLWYRGMILGDQQDSITTTDLEKILTHFGVERIAVGHTTVLNSRAFHDGKVIAIDAGIQHGRSEGIYFKKKKIYSALGDGTRIEIR
ncbi:MAG: metallophosphoesterase [Holophagaceae bacterium]|nr:metallophosphoesterase [Holophagaceae bacterium]